MSVPFTFATASTSISLSELDTNFNTAINLGNTAVYLGNTTSSIGNLTLTNVTVTNYVESLFESTGNTTISLVNGTVQKVTTSGSTTITLPASAIGKSFTVIVLYAAANALTFTGGTNLKWSNAVTPIPTSVTNKIDIFNFYQDGTNTYGSIFGQNF